MVKKLNLSPCSKTCLPSFRYRDRGIKDYAPDCNKSQFVEFISCREMSDCILPSEEIVSSDWSPCKEGYLKK